MIDTLLSSALNDYKINHEEFTNIITEKNIYENIKENIKGTADLSSLERTAEPSSLERIEEKSTVEPTTEWSALARSSLERTTL